MRLLLLTILIAGQPLYAEHPYETVGRRFTFLPLFGFSSEDGPGGGFRLSQFDYDGESVPYERALTAQGFLTTKGKWAHEVSADFPHIGRDRRLEIDLRYDKEENANYFADLTDTDLAPYTNDERTFEQIDVYLTARLIKPLHDPWRYQIRMRVGSTNITPHTRRNVIDTIAPLGYKGGYLFQLGASLRYDTRDDYTNATKGRLEEIGVEWGVGGGGNFNGGGIIFQHRHFAELMPRVVFAQRFDLVYGIGDKPFYERPKLGSSKTLRGLSADRFRDESRVLINTELRWLGMPVSKERHLFLGLNLFGDLGQVFPSDQFPSAGDWQFGSGLGLRIYWYSMVARADYGRSRGGSALYMRFSQIF